MSIEELRATRASHAETLSGAVDRSPVVAAAQTSCIASFASSGEPSTPRQTA
jgi:hypothetical protein